MCNCAVWLSVYQNMSKISRVLSNTIQTLQVLFNYNAIAATTTTTTMYVRTVLIDIYLLNAVLMYFKITLTLRLVP